MSAYRKYEASLVRRTRSPRREPVIVNTAIAILVAVVVCCVALIAGPVWTGLVESRHIPPRTEKCRHLNDVAALRDCYEKLYGQTMQPPAKGALVPLVLGPANDTTDRGR